MSVCDVETNCTLGDRFSITRLFVTRKGRKKKFWKTGDKKRIRLGFGRFIFYFASVLNQISIEAGMVVPTTQQSSQVGVARSGSSRPPGFQPARCLKIQVWKQAGENGKCVLLRKAQQETNKFLRFTFYFEILSHSFNGEEANLSQRTFVNAIYIVVSSKVHPHTLTSHLLISGFGGLGRLRVRSRFARPVRCLSLTARHDVVDSQQQNCRLKQQ